MRIQNGIVLSLFLEAISSFLFIFFISLSSNTHTTLNSISLKNSQLQDLKNNGPLYIDKGKTPEKQDITSEKTPNDSKSELLASKSQPSNSMRMGILFGSLLFGLSISLGIQVNPACSLAQWLTNPKGMQSNAILSWLLSLLAQYFGGILACLLCVKSFGHSFQFDPPSASAALTSEIFGTFFLVIVLLHFNTHFNTPKKTLIIYFVETITIAWISFAFITASRGCLNPALASCSFYAMIYFNGFSLQATSTLPNMHWAQMTPYYIGPYIGSFLASIAYSSMNEFMDDAKAPLLEAKSDNVIELPPEDYA